jgi:hypothetical protein
MKHQTKRLLLVMSGLFLGLTGVVLAERDGHEHAYEHEHEEYQQGYLQRWGGPPRPVISPVVSEHYQEECGSCHFAYQPGLLPAASWQQIMANLDAHFGENAELGEAEGVVIRDYLLSLSAGRVDQGLPRRISASIKGMTPPLRITETRFFLHEHDEIPRRMVQDNDQVRSFSNCDACHGRAAQGSFREHEIRIPGYGRWDD